MATADEILNAMQDGTELQAEEGELLIIDNDLRTITIPPEITNIGVVSDDDVKRLHFRMPRQYGEFDLSEFDIRINYLAANNTGDIYVVTDKAVSGDNITFSWLVGRSAFAAQGTVRFIVCLKKVNQEGVVEQEYNTTVATLQALEGIEPSGQIVEDNPEVIESILKRLNALEENGGTSGKDGREIELQKSSTAIQWRYAGESTWTDLVQLLEITGPAGPPGEQGPRGEIGPQGSEGENGITPTIGENGNWYLGEEDTGKPSRGEKGDPGQKGDPGDKGDPGATGATPNIQIGTVQTLEPGQDATASMSGTPENPLLNLGIPKGEKGDPGEDAEGGDSYTLPIMSNTQLGGGKAVAKTDEDVPVAVDPLTGQLFVPTYPENTGGGGGTVDPEQIKQAVNGYLEENPVSGMTAEQERQLNQNTSDVSDLKSALEQKGLPAGGTIGQVLVKKSDENYDAEWKNVSAGTSDQYFEMVEGGATTANGVSLDITGLIGNVPDYGQWDSMNNWYRVSYNSTSIPVKNGLPAEKLISKSIKGIPYFRAFTDSDSQYATSNAIAFYGCNSDKAIEEEGNQCSLCEKKFVYTPVDQLPNGTSDAGVIVAYPQEKFDYYYIRLETAFYSSSNAGKYNRLNPTHISAFDSSVLDNPLIEIGTNTEEFLRMKDEYLDGYYKNMFSHDKFKEIFKNYYAQMAPKIGIYQTCGKAIYIGGDSLHDYAGGDGVSAPGFVTTWNQYLGFSVVKNDGYAGSTWSELTGGGGLKRAKDLISNGTVYDVIILAWGTNDDTGGNGTIDDPASDAEGATMVAVMKWIITNLRNTFKSTAIGVIIPPPKNTEDGMEVRGDLMIQVCELLHVPYVDMREYISISDLGSDTVHLGTGAGKYGAAEASLILRICHYGDTLYPGTTD